MSPVSPSQFHLPIRALAFTSVLTPIATISHLNTMKTTPPVSLNGAFSIRHTCDRILRSARKLCCLLVMAAGFGPSAPAKDLTPATTTRRDGKTVARFSEAGTGAWTVPAGVASVELLVAGGGGGGCGGAEVTGGGGGGGGVYYNASHAGDSRHARRSNSW